MWDLKTLQKLNALWQEKFERKRGTTRRKPKPGRRKTVAVSRSPSFLHTIYNDYYGS